MLWHFLLEETYSDTLCSLVGDSSLLKALVLLSHISQRLFNPLICRRIIEVIYSLILHLGCNLLALSLPSPSIWLQNANIKRKEERKNLFWLAKSTYHHLYTFAGSALLIWIWLMSGENLTYSPCTDLKVIKSGEQMCKYKARVFHR